MSAGENPLVTLLGTSTSTTLTVLFDPDLNAIYECDTTPDSITHSGVTPITFTGTTQVDLDPQDVTLLG